MLNGKKTYIAALGAIAVAIGMAMQGEQTWQQAITLIIQAVLAATLRHGIAKAER